MQANLQHNTKKKGPKAEVASVNKRTLNEPRVEMIQENSDEVRDQLIEKYLPYATSIATKMARQLPSGVDYDDVLCNARLGLLEAAKRYDAKYGVEFRTFAYYRIKGAIYDGLRKTGWIPRSLYSRIKFEQAANDYLEANANRVDSRTEFYKRELAEINDAVNSVASIYVMSVDGLEDFELEDTEAKKAIEERAEFQKIKEKVCDAIESLPDKERKLIKMYYFQNKTLEEIGEQLDLSKSWTSRLHARGLELLYRKISSMGKDTLS
ncbi:MAG: sigma-70 family RNA polymerase sigma factor [Deltaproteobacteria bacterium]|nr:sigma-70 family RNA polymerase sigma factor [Deltaproteobacteria bacterium]